MELYIEDLMQSFLNCQGSEKKDRDVYTPIGNLVNRGIECARTTQ